MTAPDDAKRCPDCGGRGWYIGECHPQEKCDSCNGTGGVRPPAPIERVGPVATSARLCPCGHRIHRYRPCRPANLMDCPCPISPEPVDRPSPVATGELCTCTSAWCPFHKGTKPVDPPAPTERADDGRYGPIRPEQRTLTVEEVVAARGERVGPVATERRDEHGATIVDPSGKWLPVSEDEEPVDPPAPASAETGPKLSERDRPNDNEIAGMVETARMWLSHETATMQPWTRFRFRVIAALADEVAALEARLQEAERVMLAYVTRADDAERKLAESERDAETLVAQIIDDRKHGRATRPPVDAEAVRSLLQDAANDKTFRCASFVEQYADGSESKCSGVPGYGAPCWHHRRRAILVKLLDAARIGA